MTTRPSVANAVNKAKRCSQRWDFDSVMGSKTATRENENRRSLAQPQRFPENEPAYFTSMVKSAFAPSAVTSTSFSTPVSAPLRCIATTLYLPGGTSLMVNAPSLPVTAKYG